MRATHMLVTPEQARRWLDLNPRNRKVSTSHVSFLAKEIREGRYRENGNTIKVANTGILLDGQHRLHAIVETGVALPLLVVEDLAEDVFDTIDTGAIVRTAAQVLSLSGVVNATSTAAVVRAAIQTGEAMQGRTNTRKVPPKELMLFHEKHAETINPLLAEFVRANGPARPTTASIVGGFAAVAIARPGSLETIQTMLVALHNGANLKDGSPELALHKRLMEGMGKRKARLNQTYLQAIAVKAALAAVDGKPVGLLRYNAGEEFPHA